MKFFICLFIALTLLNLTSCHTSSLKKPQEATDNKASKDVRKKVKFTEKDKKMLSSVAVCLKKGKHCKFVIHTPSDTNQDKDKKFSCNCTDK